MGKKFKGYCYFCGKAATNREHLPPQQFFKGFNVDSLTVPSCKEHNMDKCYTDEAIAKSMLLALEKNVIIKNNDIRIALQKVKPYYNQVKSDLSERTIYKQNDASYDSIILNQNINLSDWIKKLSAGLIFYKIKHFDSNNNFDQSFVFERNSYIAHDTPQSLLMFEKEYIRKIEFTKIIEDGNWFNGWNDKKNKYPETIYKFSYKFIGKRIIIKHWFFQQFTYYNGIEISNNTISRILNKLGDGQS